MSEEQSRIGIPPLVRQKNKRLAQVKVRRDAMRALEICINGSYSLPLAPGKPPRKPNRWRRPRVEHGKPVKAGKCERCVAQHRKSR